MKRKLLKKMIIPIIIIVAVVSTLVVYQSGYFAASTNLNYGEALQKSLMFYEFQRSGVLPSDKRDNWRGDSCTTDGADVGVDLTGGWYDAGDHVKFNLPMSYTSSMLAWSIFENKDSYDKSGQMKYALDNIKWANDYFVKCHTKSNEYYYQVGDGGIDHGWWGPVEVVNQSRPSFKVTSSSPGSTVVGQTAASLAVASIVLKDVDPTRSANYLKHAKELYTFADSTKSDAGYIAAVGYYSSHSGFYDELSWAATWLYIATKDSSYLDKAEGYVANWKKETGTSNIDNKWSHCWDDVHYGTSLLLARITEKDVYKSNIEINLDFWSGNGSGSILYTPKGLAWLSEWGSLRYSTTEAFLADLYASWSGCSASKASTYKKFAKSQVDYALGSTGRSFVVGFGENPPKRPHHRTAHSSWLDSQTVPDYHRHTLYGALVGGPGKSDNYEDDIGNYFFNEVACDYNAGFVGILARMYDEYGGKLIENLNAIETPSNDEFFVEAEATSNSNSTTIRAYLINQTGWPARKAENISFRYYVDLSEVIKAGGSPDDIQVIMSYSPGGKASKLIQYGGTVYYTDVDFSKANIYPAGASFYRCEVSMVLQAPYTTSYWDSSNDFSFKEFAGSKGMKKSSIPVYQSGKLIYGIDPAGSAPTFTLPVITKPVTTKPVTTIPVTTAPVTTSVGLKGDINNDERINSTDAALIIQYILGQRELTKEQFERADVTKDGKITSSDAAKLDMYISGKIDSF